MSHINVLIVVACVTVILSAPHVTGYGLVTTQGNVTMSNPIYNITLLPTIYLSSMSSDETTLSLGLNGTSLNLNSSTNFTLSNLTNVQNSDRINFTTSATGGTLNISAKMQNINLIYYFTVDGVNNATDTSNNTGYVFFNYSGWSQHDFSIFLNAAYNNTAPNLLGISLTPSTKKYNKTITVSTSSNITDSESSLVQLQVYRYISGTKNYFGNSSWVTPPNNASVTITIPWSDGLAHTIYAQAEDSGNATGQNNLTSGEVSAIFTSDITSPTVNSSTVTPSSVTTGNDVIITITADGKGANISSANVTITRPDLTVVTLTLTCTYTSGDISTCTRTYTANSGAGTYSIDSFGLTDDSGNTATPASILTFTATTASSGSSSGGGGGSSVTTIIKENATTATPLLSFKNITEGATEPQLQEIADCLTNSLFLVNKCSSYNFGVIVEPMNWWVFAGAFFASFGVVVGKGLYQDKQREWYTEPLLYGTTTTLILVILVAVGFNMYILNYLVGSSKYAWTFGSTALWGGIVALAWDNYYYGKKTYKIQRTA